MLGAFSSVLENMPGGNYLGIVLKVIGILAGVLLALTGLLAKFNKLPVHLVMAETTMVLTRKGQLQCKEALLYRRKYRRLYPKGDVRDELNKGAPLKTHTKGLVWLIPWYWTPEVFDHRRNTQSLAAITVEKMLSATKWCQWKFPLAIASVIGRSDAEIRNAWLAAQDRDENLRMLVGQAVDDTLRLIDDQAEFTRSGFAKRVTDLTYPLRVWVRLITGIWVTEILFPEGSFRTDVDAIRGLGESSSPITSAVAAHHNGKATTGA